MEKREAELKSALFKRLRSLPFFVVLELSTAGAPDRAISGRGRTTMWEFKHGTPDFDSPGNQELLCMRLAQAAHCRYVVWQSDKNGEHTHIVHPLDVHNRVGWKLKAQSSCVGFDMQWLVLQILKAHEN